MPRLRPNAAALRVLPAALFVALCGLGSTCDDADISGRQTLTLTAGETAIEGFQQPYVGRLALDFGLRNTGDSVGVYDLTVQAQTSGQIDEAACEDGVSSEPRVVQADPNIDDAPVVRDTDRAHFINLDDGADDAFVSLRIVTTGTWRLYLSQRDSVALFAQDGTEVSADAQRDTTSCSLFEEVLDFALTDGTYALRVDADGTTLLLQEACEDVRTVDATCPGANEDAFAHEAIGLEAGSFISGRIHETELGIGDRAIVGLSCNPITPDCEAELELFFVTRQLECRTDLDCANIESCQSDGYCLRTRDRGCQQAGPLGGAWLLSLLGPLAWWRRRR